MNRLIFDGSICVCPAHEADSEIDDILVLGQMPDRHTINKKLPQYKDKPSSVFKQGVELKFTNAKSVDVVINALITIRKSIKNKQ